MHRVWTEIEDGSGMFHRDGTIRLGFNPEGTRSWRARNWITALTKDLNVHVMVGSGSVEVSDGNVEVTTDEAGKDEVLRLLRAYRRARAKNSKSVGKLADRIRTLARDQAASCIARHPEAIFLLVDSAVKRGKALGVQETQERLRELVGIEG